MNELPQSLESHRVRADDQRSVLDGHVRYSPAKSLWFSGMALVATVGGALTFGWSSLAVFAATTATVLLLGHSLGSHRKLIHDSYQCPKWLEYTLVYCGIQVGLAGPLGLLRQHELRDYAQRLPNCHAYLRHGSSFWLDGWWQLHCELVLDHPPAIAIEPRIAGDRFYRFLERTWMAQQLLPGMLLFAWGGWAFVIWGVCGRVTAGVLGHWLIGYFAHNRGGRHYDVRDAAVQGRNIRCTSLLTMGESWHNNHHAFPGSARLGLFAGEWDPGWWLLMVLRKAGLAWNFRLPADLPARAELCAIDEVGMTKLSGPAGAPMPAARTRLSRVAAQCIKARALTMTPAMADVCELSGPAATVSARMTRWILGPRVPFTRNPALPRLSLHIGGSHIRGLPALCIALSRRHPLSIVIGLGLAPLAVAFENIRESFDVA
jgi:fatty-acid desaturase